MAFTQEHLQRVREAVDFVLKLGRQPGAVRANVLRAFLDTDGVKYERVKHDLIALGYALPPVGRTRPDLRRVPQTYRQDAENYLDAFSRGALDLRQARECVRLYSEPALKVEFVQRMRQVYPTSNQQVLALWERIAESITRTAKARTDAVGAPTARMIEVVRQRQGKLIHYETPLVIKNMPRLSREEQDAHMTEFFTAVWLKQQAVQNFEKAHGAALSFSRKMMQKAPQPFWERRAKALHRFEAGVRKAEGYRIFPQDFKRQVMDTLYSIPAMEKSMIAKEVRNDQTMSGPEKQSVLAALKLTPREVGELTRLELGSERAIIQQIALRDKQKAEQLRNRLENMIKVQRRIGLWLHAGKKVYSQAMQKYEEAWPFLVRRRRR